MPETKAKFVVETIQPKTKFDPKSFRTVVARAHRITIGCPKGSWDPILKRCKVSTQIQRILHPKKEILEKNPCPFRIKKKPERIRKNIHLPTSIEIVATRLYGKGYGVSTVAKKLKEQYGLSKGDAEYYAKRAAAISRGARKIVHPEVKKEVFPVLRENEPVEVYDKVIAIEAQKGPKSKFPKERFRHDFSKDKTAAKVYGLPDGSLLIKSTKGKRLWKKFSY